MIKIKLPGTEITIAEEELNFNKMEQKIWEIQMQQGRAIMEKTLEELDNLLAENRSEGLKNKGFRSKYLSSRFGEIFFHRRGYYDSANKFRYLLDEKVGLAKAQRVSSSRAKLEASLAFTKSYRETEGTFKFLLGSSRSFEAIRQQVITIGTELQAEGEREAEEIFEGKEAPDYPVNSKTFAALEADGTGIALQGESQKRAEVKLGIGYEGWGRRYRSGTGKSFGLLRKFVYMGIEEGEKFSEKFSLFAYRKLGLEKVKHVIIGGDGAAWISFNLVGHFVGAVYQLCKFHLNRAIKRSLPFSEEVQKQLKDKLRADKIDEALGLLRELFFRVGRKEGEKIKELITYISNNRHGINGIKKLKQRLSKEERDELRCTGAIEGNIDKAVCNRLKKRGMRWSILGASCLLKVGEKMLNGEWESWWSEIKKFQPQLISSSPPPTKRYRNVLGKPHEDVWKEYLEHNLPVLHGSAQDRKWVELLKEKIYLVEN
jgi:hypothetical protein